DGEGWLARQLEGSGVAIEHFQPKHSISVAGARWLAAAFRRHDIAIAHSHEFSMAVYGSCAAWLAGIPHVITMHGSLYYAARLRRRLALRAAIALSGQTVATSNHLARQVSDDLRVDRVRIATIPNGSRYVRPDAKLVRGE